MRSDSDDTGEDALLHPTPAARKAVENHLNRPPLTTPYRKMYPRGYITEDIQLAILMLTAHFENRVSNAEVKLYRVPQAYEYLIGRIGGESIVTVHQALINGFQEFRG